MEEINCKAKPVSSLALDSCLPFISVGLGLGLGINTWRVIESSFVSQDMFCIEFCHEFGHEFREHSRVRCSPPWIAEGACIVFGLNAKYKLRCQSVFAWIH